MTVGVGMGRGNMRAVALNLAWEASGSVAITRERWLQAVDEVRIPPARDARRGSRRERVCSRDDFAELLTDSGETNGERLPGRAPQHRRELSTT